MSAFADFPVESKDSNVDLYADLSAGVRHGRNRPNPPQDREGPGTD